LVANPHGRVLHAHLPAVVELGGATTPAPKTNT
jgi:hypothetical protein